MDEATLTALEAALSASPDNPDLLSVVLKACVDRDEPSRAARWLTPSALEGLELDAHRQLAATVLLSTDAAETALGVLTTDSPESLLLRARALLALDRRGPAQQAYDEAVAGNPTLEDPGLRDRLRGRVRDIDTARGPLRVISNDDTDDSEVDRLLAPEVHTVTFSDVGGLDAVKQQISKRIITPFQKPSLFARFKKRVGGGILLYGPPGCGKTLLARATAGECGASFFNVEISDVLDMYMGESEQKLHALFDKARAAAPSVLFFDEIEALGGKRQYTREATSSKLVSQFLAEMDGFAKDNHGVLILGATNVPWAVDAAFRRPGRFDRVLFVPPPDQLARARILDILLEDRPTEGDLGIEAMAKATTGFSGADLSNLVETAVDEAIEASMTAGHEKPVTGQHLKGALREVKSTTLEWLTTARNYARYANESGQYDEVLDFIARHGKR